MARSIPSSEPTRAVAGDTWAWNRTFADFPSSEGWSISYEFRGPSALTIQGDQVSVGDNGDYEVRVPTESTARLLPGPYQWAAYATLDGERYQVARGNLTVRADLVTTEARATQAERELAIVNDAILGRLTADTESFVIAGRQVSKIPIETLRTIRGELRAEVARYRRRNRKAIQTAGVRFG